MRTLSVLVALVALSIDAAVASTMRCANGIVAHGERSAQVLEKCGEPASREVFPPALDEFGNIVQGAVAVELWTYGPNNGMHQYLRFIDGRLVQIRSQR
jgi:hypothetical protein